MPTKVNDSYHFLMSRVPAVRPDGAKIGQLIWDRGYSRAGFARQLRRSGAKSIYNIISTNQRSSVELVREIARVLGVSYEEIILSDDTEPKARVA